MQSMHTQQTKELHIPSLDGIRGLAALTVFVSHAGLREIVPGGFGVTVFFFLSGYLITTLLRREFEQTRTISFRRFYLRRILRIIPPMYIMLLIGMVLAFIGIFPNRMTLAGVAAQFAHLTNYYMIFFGTNDFVPSTSSMWSLAVEEHFYLLFPLAIYAMFRRWNYRHIALALFAVCVAVLLWRICLVYWLGVGHDYTYPASDTRLDSLLFGCIMGVWCNPALDADANPLGSKAWAGLFGIGMVLLLISFLYRDPAFRESSRYSIQGVGLFAAFYCAVRYCHWPIFAWLQSRPARAMGLISYTFYLCHLMILRLVDIYIEGSTLVRAAIAFVGSVAFSTAMYYLVERRLALWRRRLHKSQGRGRGSSRATDTVQEIPVGAQTAAIEER